RACTSRMCETQTKRYYHPCVYLSIFFFSSRRRHTRSKRDWSSDVCSSDLFKFNLGLKENIDLRSTDHFLVSSLSAASHDLGHGNAVDFYLIEGVFHFLKLFFSDDCFHLDQHIFLPPHALIKIFPFSQNH